MNMMSALCQRLLVYNLAMAFTERSDQTRAAILTAARRRFASDGYERATIRVIAADAGIDPAMVIRYYASKDGLLQAAMDVDLQLPDLTAVPRERVGETLVGHCIARWEGELADEALSILLRSVISNETAAGRLRAIFEIQVAGALIPAVNNPAELPVRAGLVSTQLLGVAVCRNIVRLPPVVALTPEALVANVGPTIQRYLTEPLDL
jgi:AcrR family transcriptional regulator